MRDRKYRVLHLIHRLQRRGAEVFAAQLASQIEQNGLIENAVCSLYSGDETLQTALSIP